MTDDAAAAHPKIVAAAHGLLDGDIENAMEDLAMFFEEDAARSDHPTVKTLLENCRDAARQIGFEWYASLK